MACNVCGEKVGKCKNDECSNDLGNDFKCFNGVHFCSEGCWVIWLTDENIGSLEEAEDDEDEKIDSL